jgi:hypothetical protein
MARDEDWCDCPFEHIDYRPPAVPELDSIELPIEVPNAPPDLLILSLISDETIGTRRVFRFCDTVEKLNLLRQPCRPYGVLKFA